MPIWIERVTPRGTRTHKSRWKCECGETFVASDNNVTRGHTASCGCKYANRSIIGPVRHGHYVGGKPSPTYVVWQSMVARCCNPNDTGYFRYGARGVKIDRRWREDFREFLKDMGERPDGLTIDRWPNPFGHYQPGNCRWATMTEQNRNKRMNFAKYDPDRAADYEQPWMR